VILASDTATLQGIYRFPVKGLTPEPLQQVALMPGQTVPNDRLYAIENGPSGFDPSAPSYQPKIRFLMLMRNERLATLRTRFDDESHMLTVTYDGHEAARGDLRTSTGRAAIEAFFASFSADDLRGPPKILHAPGFSFSDVAAKVVSIINLASVADLETIIGAPVDPLRFRANLYVTGWPAWQELDMVGRTLTVGDGIMRHGVTLKITKRIVRCAATNVDPVTGARDLAIPDTLMKTFGHADCGVYAQVTTPGAISVGDRLQG
jgi:MOSC domain-containing protein